MILDKKNIFMPTLYSQLNSTQVYYNLVVGRPNSTINHNT